MPITNTLKNSDSLEQSFSTEQAKTLAQVVEDAVSKTLHFAEKRMDNRFVQMNERIDARFQSVEKRIEQCHQQTNERITTLYWVVGFAVAVFAVIASFK